MVDVFGFEVEDQSWKCGCLLSRATVDWLPRPPPECLRLVRPNGLPRAARAGLSQAQGSRPSFDTQLLVHAGAAPGSLQLEPTQWSCWCFGKARPLTPYQAAALGNLAGSVLHCLEHCSAWRCWLAYRAGPSRPDVSLRWTQLVKRSCC